MVKLEVPEVVGVPVIAPVAVANDKPWGRAPAVILYVYGPVPPEAVTVWLYATETSAAGNVAGEKVIVCGPIVIKVDVLVANWPSGLVTVIVRPVWAAFAATVMLRVMCAESGAV